MDREKMAALEELSGDVIFNDDLLGSNYFRKLKMIVLEFQKRGWLID